MTHYRFLPWTRQGLAARISSDQLKVRAELPVRLRVNDRAPVEVAVTLHGPGDVIGVDPRGIVRVEPSPSSTAVEPNYLVAIEFDRPDFPWMFTPAAAGADDRLRPWLVLVVVERTADTRVTTNRNRPLPSIRVDTAELPALDDSWAWAHTQVITEIDTTEAILDSIRSQPDLTVSRLLCPRRLAADTEYIACLVPAFAAGVGAGLGEPRDATDTTGTQAPAWSDADRSVQLPVYHHWEFATGPAGDFESLARRLRPPDRPLDVGTVPVYVGRADPGLPVLGEPAAVVSAEGALVGPFHDSTSSPVDPGVDWLAALARLLDAGVDDPDDPSDRPPIAPPLHGAWPAGVHRTPTDEPLWVGDLNLDARQRIVAGVGVEVVRAEQEAIVHDAWEQVGDLPTANALVDRGRLSREIGAVLHRRLFAAADGERTFRLVTPAHRRVLLDGVPVATRLHDSAVPDGVASPAFRRMTARGGVLRRRARKHAPGVSGRTAAPPAPPVGNSLVTRLDAGGLAAEPPEIVPDALISSRALEALGPIGDGEIDLTPIGGTGTIDAKVLKSLRAAATKVGRPPLPSKIVARPDLPSKGVIVDRLPVVPPGGPVIVQDRAIPVDPRDVDRSSVARVPVGRPPADRPPVARPPVGRPPVVRPPVDRPPVDRPPVVRPPVDRPPVDPEPPRDPPVKPLPPIVVVRRFSAALATHVATLAEPRPAPARPALGIEQVRVGVSNGIDPRRVVPARVASMIRLPRAPDAGRDAPREVVSFEPDLRGLTGHPRLDRPLYEAVATHAPEWLLPGIGDIPADTVALLATNPRAVEALMIGANTELLAELLWREYPTRRDGTPMRHFWDRADGRPDLPDLSGVDPAARLGELGGGDGSGDAVLVVRGELLRRYPSTIVSIVKSTASGRPSKSPTDQHEATMRGRIDPDVTFVGFDVTIAEITGDPGYFIVLQQQPTELRFGFDVPDGDPSVPPSWHDATWAHIGVEPGGFLPASDATGIVEPSTTDGATWLPNAAHLATIAMQQPVRVAIHAGELLASQVI